MINSSMMTNSLMTNFADLLCETDRMWLTLRWWPTLGWWPTLTTNSLPISSSRPILRRATRQGTDLSPTPLIHVSYDETCHHQATSGYAHITPNGHRGLYSDPYIGRTGQRVIPSVRWQVTKDPWWHEKPCPIRPHFWSGPWNPLRRRQRATRGRATGKYDVVPRVWLHTTLSRTHHTNLVSRSLSFSLSREQVTFVRSYPWAIKGQVLFFPRTHMHTCCDTHEATLRSALHWIGCESEQV
jgi:hypothetical protein